MSRRAAQAWLCSKLGINLPYYSMGKVDTYDLFGPNELILFAFYEHNRERYRKVLDIGANVGLHTMLMMDLGWEVRAFEPDQSIFLRCKENVEHKKWSLPPWNVARLSQCAVSDCDGEAQFVRVLDNLTGSHIEGYKQSYGPRETITVKTVDCRPLFDWADLAKIDVEGHESVLLKCLTREHLSHLDLICELRGQEEAAAVLAHISDLGGEIYTQKTDWKPARSMAAMPTKHQEGSIFISSRGGPWSSQEK